MTDQEVLTSTLREARRIIGEYTGPRNANQTLTQLIACWTGRTWPTPLKGLRRVPTTSGLPR